MPVANVPDKSAARLSETVYQTLLEAVLSGSLAPGAVISELALSKSLEVSRTPVHDAVRQLVRDGLVRQEKNRRAVVAESSTDDIREVFEMRQLLEGEAAFRAAALLDRPAVDDLRADLDDLAARWGTAGWVERWADHDDHFHGAVAKACGSARLRQEIRKYRVLHRGLNRTHAHTRPEVVRLAVGEHRAILTALAARDAEGARVAMVRHIREWQAIFVQNFSRPRAD